MRKAQYKDIDNIMKIINDAKKSLRKDKVDQWQKGVPNIENIKNDIDNQKGYVYYNKDNILAYAFLKDGIEESYEVQEDKFKYKNYLTIHRFCVDGNYRRENIATKFFGEIYEYARKRGFDSIRIDTHRDNFKMRGFIRKNKFSKVATVYVDYNGVKKERIAYELYIN